MQKILYICPTAGIGGAETFLKQTFTQANKEDFQNVYLFFQSGPLYQDLLALGARVELLPKRPQLSRGEDRKAVEQKIKELINRYNIDLVHSTMAYAALFSARICKKMNVPHVWFQHGPASGWMDRLAAILPHQGLVVNSHYTSTTQRKLENPFRFLIPRKIPIEKILLGTDLKKPEQTLIGNQRVELQKKFSIPSEHKLACMLCRIQHWKGVHLFVEAFEDLKSKGSPVSGVVFGEAFKDEKYLNDLKKLVQDKQLPVYFAGRTELPALSLSACDMVINASVQAEPFGLSVIEGMMMGAVPIVADQGGPVEVIHHGTNGLIFETGNALSLAQKINTLAQDSELLAKLSQQAVDTAEQKYTAGRAIAQLENFHVRVFNEFNNLSKPPF